MHGIPYIKLSLNFIERFKINQKDIICKSFKEDKYLIKQNNSEKIIYPVKLQSIYLIRREEKYTKCEIKNRIVNEKDILIEQIKEIASIEKSLSISNPKKAVPNAVENTISAVVNALIPPKYFTP